MGAMRSPRIWTESFMRPRMRGGCSSTGSRRATGRPRLVMRISWRERWTSSRRWRHLALNSPAAIWCFIPWSFYHGRCELRREPQDFHFRAALDRGLGPIHDLCGYGVREVIFAAVLAHFRWSLFQDHSGGAALKSHRRLSWASLPVLADHAIHCSLRFLNPGSHCSGCGSYAVTIMHVPVPASDRKSTRLN